MLARFNDLSASARGTILLLVAMVFFTVMMIGTRMAGQHMPAVQLMFLRGILMFGGLAAMGLIVASILFGFTLGMFFSYVMVAFACGYILYDTSNVLHHFHEDSYVAASLELFASIALMFWYVLRIFISSRD